jgi:FkbM family methyltransferase
LFELDQLFRKTAFAPALADYPLVAIDVGARGAFEPDLRPISFAVDAIGFEPDPKAYAALSIDGRWRSLRFEPVALSGGGGMRRLHIPRDPQSATLLEPNRRLGEEFDKTQFFDVVQTLDVATETLDAAAQRLGLERIDYLKLDVEGAEREILEGAEITLKRLLAVKVEVLFAPARHQQPFAGDIDAHLRARGFRLMEMIRPAAWRRRGYIIHPQVDRSAVPYSKGQLIQADYLFFREPDRIETVADVLRLGFLAMAYGFFDMAETLFTRADVARALTQDYGLDIAAAVGQASALYGRRAWAQAFLAQVRGFSPLLRSLVRMAIR